MSEKGLPVWQRRASSTVVAVFSLLQYGPEDLLQFFEVRIVVFPEANRVGVDGLADLFDACSVDRSGARMKIQAASFVWKRAVIEDST
jgi:hypothetical protein